MVTLCCIFSSGVVGAVCCRVVLLLSPFCNAFPTDWVVQKISCQSLLVVLLLVVLVFLLVASVICGLIVDVAL